MKICLTFCLIISVLSSSSVFAQKDNNANVNPKSTLFTPKERDSMQVWFYNRATAMGLSNEIRDEYYNIILYHSYKMKGLEKKDKGYTPEEIRTKFDGLLQKQHKEIKAILDDKQYTYYLNTYEKLLKGVFERKGWK
nr:hypothetical protein [uncultured Allomuricauda sp.]